MSLKKSATAFSFLVFCWIVSNICNAALHDPTKPLISFFAHESSLGDDDFILQSILIGPTRRLAMINGQLVGTGSSIQGARVLAIDKNHVVLFSAGQRKVLHLFGGRLWKAH